MSAVRGGTTNVLTRLLLASGPGSTAAFDKQQSSTSASSLIVVCDRRILRAEDDDYETQQPERDAHTVRMRALVRDTVGCDPERTAGTSFTEKRGDHEEKRKTTCRTVVSDRFGRSLRRLGVPLLVL